MALKERSRISVSSICSFSAGLLLIETDTEGTFRPERIVEIAERFGGMNT